MEELDRSYINPTQPVEKMIEGIPISAYSQSIDLDIAFYQPPILMDSYHWHPQIELNIPFGDCVDYQFSEGEVSVSDGHVALFWALIPHRLIRRYRCRAIGVINIPFDRFLSWGLNAKLISAIIHGEVIESNIANLCSHAKAMRWAQELTLQQPERQQLIYDEIQLICRRLVLDGFKSISPHQNIHVDNVKPITTQNIKVIQHILTTIANNYDDCLSVKAIANNVGLSTNYITRIFKQTMNISIKNYIILMRINYTKVLLRDTNRPILDIALSAGFSGLSRFYEHFTKLTHTSPEKYRREMQQFNWSS